MAGIRYSVSPSGSKHRERRAARRNVLGTPFADRTERESAVMKGAAAEGPVRMRTDTYLRLSFVGA
jgi:hypothetical protein